MECISTLDLGRERGSHCAEDTVDLLDAALCFADETWDELQTQQAEGGTARQYIVCTTTSPGIVVLYEVKVCMSKRPRISASAQLR